MNPYRTNAYDPGTVERHSRWYQRRMPAWLGGLIILCVASGVQAQTAPLRLNGVKFGPNDISVYVTAYGADGTGVANSSTAFINAANAATNGGTVRVPSGTYLLNSSITLPSKNVRFIGDGRNTTIINGPSAAAILTPTGTFTQIEIAGITLNCSGAGSKLIDLTGTTSSEGWISIHDNLIQHCQSTAITSGVSTYISTIRDNTFLDNAGSINLKQHSDTRIENNFFENPRSGSTPNITIASSDVHVVGNYFITGGTGWTGPDILVNPIDADGLSGGYDWITQNKFGSESDTSGRAKIQCFNSTATSPCGPVIVNENHFLGNPAGSTAILLSNPVHRWSISGNYFKDITKVVDDVQVITGLPIAAMGESIFGPGNVFYPSTAWTLFTNGGRQFNQIDPQHLAASTIGPQIRQQETIEVRNRLTWSEDLSNAAWTKTGVSITTGQTDPYGSTRAMLLTRSNAATFENAQIAVDNTAMTTRFVVTFWAKAGSATTLQAGIYDNTASSMTGQLGYFQLGSGWSKYRFIVNGVTAGHSYILFIYPKDTTQSAGTVNVFGVQVSDYDSDYVPTSGAVVADTTDGTRFERRVLANSGVLANLFDTPASSTTMNIGQVNATTINMSTSGSQRWAINSAGTLFPAVDNSIAFGAASNRASNMFAMRQTFGTQTIAAATSITIAPSSGDKVRINLSATAITSLTYTAGVDGEQSRVCVAEDATGTRTIPTTWTNVRFAGGTYVVTTTLNKIDCIDFVYDSTAAAWLEVGRSMNM